MNVATAGPPVTIAITIKPVTTTLASDAGSSLRQPSRISWS